MEIREEDRTMTAESILAQIKTIESQLDELKEHAKQLRAPDAPKTFADLYGILAGHGDFTEEEIDAALIRFKWEDEDPEDEAE
jgi:hypothetical protein